MTKLLFGNNEHNVINYKYNHYIDTNNYISNFIKSNLFNNIYMSKYLNIFINKNNNTNNTTWTSNKNYTDPNFIKNINTKYNYNIYCLCKNNNLILISFFEFFNIICYIKSNNIKDTNYMLYDLYSNKYNNLLDDKNFKYDYKLSIYNELNISLIQILYKYKLKLIDVINIFLINIKYDIIKKYILEIKNKIQFYPNNLLLFLLDDNIYKDRIIFISSYINYIINLNNDNNLINKDDKYKNIFLMSLTNNININNINNHQISYNIFDYSIIFNYIKTNINKIKKILDRIQYIHQSYFIKK
jgi:hypothetical protein